MGVYSSENSPFTIIRPFPKLLAEKGSVYFREGTVYAFETSVYNNCIEICMYLTLYSFHVSIPLAGSQAELVVIPDSDDNGVVRVRSRGTWKTFDLDRVFSIGSRQEEVLCTSL